MKGRRTLKSGCRKGISETDIQRTADRAAATHPIIGLHTLTLVKGAVVNTGVIHTNLRTIVNGSLVAHNGLLIAETTIGHGLRLQIDLARPPLSTVCHHVQISPRMTREGQPGIGEGSITLATNLVTDITVQTTFRQYVMTDLREIRGGLHTSTDRDPLRPLHFDLLGWIMLQLLFVLTMRRLASIPLHRRPQTPHLHPLQNDPYPQNINLSLSRFLRRNRSLPSSAGLPQCWILNGPLRTYQSLNQELSTSLPHHNRNVRTGRGALVRKRS